MAVPPDWTLEVEEEDRSLLLFRSGHQCTLRVAEFPATVSPSPSHSSRWALSCVVNEHPPCARSTASAAGAAGGFETREWIVTLPETTVHITFQSPQEVADDERQAVAAILDTLQFHSHPHPAVEALLKLLHADPVTSTLSAWKTAAPLTLIAGTHEISLEPFISASSAFPSTTRRLAGTLARRVRNLILCENATPPLTRISDSVLPLIRGSVIREAHGHPLLCGEALARRCFAPGLFVYWAVDLPGGFHFLPADFCARNRIHPEQLEALAVENLTHEMTEGETTSITMDEHGVVMCEDGSGLAASRLLIPKFRQRLRQIVKLPYRIAMPTAGVLLVFASTCHNVIDAIGEDVWEALSSDPVPITQQFYENRGTDIFVPLQS